MRRWALISILGVAIWAGVVFTWAVHSWTDAQPMKVPHGAIDVKTGDTITSLSATFRCTAPFSAPRPGRLTGATATTFPLDGGPPCGEHGQYRNLGIIDLGGSVIAVALLLAFGRRRREAMGNVVSTTR